MKKDDLEEDVKYFVENYTPLFHYVHNLGEIQYIDDPDDGKICRFCGKNSTEVTFKKKAHALSELIGNKEFVSRTECDVCNEHFGQFLEDSLSKYLGCGRTVSQIMTKTGVPSYKSKDGKCRIDFTEKGLVIQEVQDSGFTEIKDNYMIIHAVRQKYSPLSVYKALVKMALSMLPYKEMIYFTDTAAWLKERSNIISNYDMRNYEWMIERFVPGPHPLPLEVWGFLRKDDSKIAFYYQFVISFGNLITQIAVPCRAKDDFENETDISIVPMPHVYDFCKNSYGNITTDIRIMSNPGKVENEPFDICMNIESKECHDGNGQKIDELLEKEGIKLKGRLGLKK